MSAENRTLKEELERSKREIGELKAKLSKSEQMQKSKETEISQLKGRLAAFDKKEPPRKSDQIVKQGISICISF